MGLEYQVAVAGKVEIAVYNLCLYGRVAGGGVHYAMTAIVALLEEVGREL